MKTYQDILEFALKNNDYKIFKFLVKNNYVSFGKVAKKVEFIVNEEYLKAIRHLSDVKYKNNSKDKIISLIVNDKYFDAIKILINYKKKYSSHEEYMKLIKLVKEDPSEIANIDNNYLTNKLCIEALKQDVFIIKYIPIENQTKEVYWYMLIKYKLIDSLYKYIKNKDLYKECCNISNDFNFNFLIDYDIELYKKKCKD